jgi:hypothetical protein
MHIEDYVPYLRAKAKERGNLSFREVFTTLFHGVTWEIFGITKSKKLKVGFLGVVNLFPANPGTSFDLF